MSDENHLPHNTADQSREIEHFRDEGTMEEILKNPEPSPLGEDFLII